VSEGRSPSLKTSPSPQGKGIKGMGALVKSNICPVCLADIEGEYVEEGDLRISDEVISCPKCGFSFQGVMDECPELDKISQGERVGLLIKKCTPLT